MSLSMVTLRTPTKMDRIDRYIAKGTLWSLMVMGTWFGLTIFYPWNPVTKLQIAVVDNPHVGQSITIEVDYCKARAWTPSVVRWSLVNDIVIVLPPTTMSLPVGCHVKRIAVPLPIHTIPGKYRMREELFYQPWPWRTFSYEAESSPFTMGGDL